MKIKWAALAAAVCLGGTAARASSADSEAIATAEAGMAADDHAGDAAMAKPGRKRSSLLDPGGRLLLTGGVSTIEGAGGGGLVPWALIGGYGTRNEIGISSYVTGVDTQDFTLASYGAAINVKNRLELSVARQNFNLREIGNALALGNRYTISQTIIGAKLRLIGDAVLEQDSLLPQIAIGVQHKINDDVTVVGGALGLQRRGTDFYIAATKLFLAQSLLVNVTGRLTKANQFGILGFGGLGGQNQAYKPQLEASAALLLSRKLAVGAEYRTKSNRLEGALGGSTFREENAWDVFVAYAPIRNVSVTLAYARLGQIALARQNGAYASLQIGF